MPMDVGGWDLTLFAILQYVDNYYSGINTRRIDRDRDGFTVRT